MARATVGGGMSSMVEWYVHSAPMERLAGYLLAPAATARTRLALRR